MIVSFPLTIALRQFISKTLREGKQQQLDSLKKKIEKLNRSQKSRLACRKQQTKRKRKRGDPSEQTSLQGFVLKDSRTQVATMGDAAAEKPVQCNEPGVQNVAEGEWDGQLKTIQGGRELKISDVVLEVQENAIITLQVCRPDLMY